MKLLVIDIDSHKSQFHSDDILNILKSRNLNNYQIKTYVGNPGAIILRMEEQEIPEISTLLVSSKLKVYAYGYIQLSRTIRNRRKYLNYTKQGPIPPKLISHIPFCFSYLYMNNLWIHKFEDIYTLWTKPTK